MAQVSYPGVYVDEIPSGVRTIVGVATSITAFIGRTPRGPVEKATVVNSFGDFVRQFGSLDPTFTVPYAVRDFFQNGGGQAVIVRLYAPLFRKADGSEDEAARTRAFNDAVTAADAGAMQGADDAIAEVSKALTSPAAGPAKSAKQVIKEIETASAAIANDAARKREEKDAARYIVDKALVKLRSEYTDGDVLADDATKNTAINTEASGAKATAVNKAKEAAGGRVAPNTTAKFDYNGLKATSKYPGVWGNKVTFRVTDGSAEAADTMGLTKSDLFNLEITDAGTGQIETFLNLTVVASSRKADSVVNSQSNLLNITEVPAAVPPSHAANAFTGYDPANPATNGNPLQDTDYTAGTEADKKGIHALDDADLFNLLCIPPDVPGGETKATVYQSALPYCVFRRAVLIVDPLTEMDTKANAKDKLGDLGLNGTDARNAALYFPRVQMPNPAHGGLIETFPACGIVAGVIARTDGQRGVWKAPAGIDAGLNGISGLSVNLTDKENGELNPLGINCLRSFRDYGRVVWGARTLRGNDAVGDEYKYLPVRRLALYIEESLFRGLQWVVFEPNDEPLWAQIRLNVGAFMNGLFKQGAFAGTTTQQAYFVKCDKENNPQSEVDLGKVHIRVGFAPLKPAEFVIIELQQIAGKLDV